MTEPFAQQELTCDRFLGGRIALWQPRKGYRSGSDAVFLAAACPAEPGQQVLEFGCGAGVALICLKTRVEGLHLTGIERQAAYAELARRNGPDCEILTGDLRDASHLTGARSFDHVIMNPPYYRPGSNSPDRGRAAARSSDLDLGIWIEQGAKRLRPKGWLTLIHLAERLPEILSAALPRFGSLTILPLSPRATKPATRVILCAQKGSRAATVLLNPLILHDGDRHLRDEDSYSDRAKSVLMEAQSLPLR